MRIEIKMSGVDDTAIAVILKALREIEHKPYHYIGYQDFSIKIGDE